PGVAVENAIALPAGAPLRFSASGDWALPPGTALLRHTRLLSGASSSSPGRPLETRLFVTAEPCGYGAAYRWREDGRDAELVEDGEVATVNLPGSKARGWFFSGVEDCLASPGASLAFAPMFQLNARQLNQPGAGNPLRQLARRHLLEGLPADPELLA